MPVLVSMMALFSANKTEKACMMQAVAGLLPVMAERT
jgi:hypothetical protein